MEQQLTFRTASSSSLPGLKGKLIYNTTDVNETTKRVTATLQVYASYSFFMNASSGTYVSIDGTKYYLNTQVNTSKGNYVTFLNASKDIQYYGDKTISIGVYVGFIPNGIQYNSVAVSNYANTYSYDLPTNLLPAEYMPIIDSFTVSDINTKTTSLTGNAQRVIVGYSNVKANYIVHAQRGNTIKKVELINGAKSVSSTSSNSNLTINAIEDNVITLQVTDSKDYVTTQSIVMTKVNYTELTNVSEAIKEASASESIILNINGLVFGGSFGSLNNVVSAKYRYKKSIDQSFSDWINVSLSISDNKYNQQVSVSDIDYTSAYVVEVSVSDKLDTKIQIITVPKGTPAIAFDDEIVALYGRLFVNDDEVILNKIKFIQQGNIEQGSSESIHLDGNTMHLVFAYSFTTLTDTLNVSFCGNFSNDLMIPIKQGTNAPTLSISNGDLTINAKSTVNAIYMIFKLNV